MRIYTQQLASHISACTGAVCAFVYYVKSKKRSNCCGRLQLGDATIRTTLYLDRHGNQNAADVVLLVYARSLCTPHLLLQLATPSDVPSVEPRHHTNLTRIHALMYVTQCANACAHKHTRHSSLLRTWLRLKMKRFPSQMASKAMQASTLTMHL